MTPRRVLRFLSAILVLTIVSGPLVGCGPPKRKAPPLRTTIPDPLAEEGAQREIQGVMAGPGADLSGMDLSREDLSGLDLSGADLSGANLARAYLSRSKFVGANLSGADIDATNAYRADFTDADLTGATFIGSNSEEAIFTGARLEGADFTYAFLRGATFDESAISEVLSFSGATMPDGSISE
jgi:uncharacterized protein YjbI with pentapeptide repeats